MLRPGITMQLFPGTTALLKSMEEVLAHAAFSSPEITVCAMFLEGS